MWATSSFQLSMNNMSFNNILIAIGQIINTSKNLNFLKYLLLAANTFGIIVALVKLNSLKSVHSGSNNTNTVETAKSKSPVQTKLKPLRSPQKPKKKTVNFGRSLMGEISVAVECTFDTSAGGADTM
jgi:hypothetical protein